MFRFILYLLAFVYFFKWFWSLFIASNVFLLITSCHLCLFFSLVSFHNSLQWSLLLRISLLRLPAIFDKITATIHKPFLSFNSYQFFYCIWFYLFFLISTVCLENGIVDDWKLYFHNKMCCFSAFHFYFSFIYSFFICFIDWRY